MSRILLALPVMFLAVGMATAGVKTKTITYEHDGTTLKGFLVWPEAATGKLPGILVVHEWWGLNDYARKRAEMLAEMGYVAFACDMYGDGKVTEHPQEAGKMASEVRKNVKAWKSRAQAGLKVLTEQEHVDPKKLAAIGYCFGGSTALQLAYSGADLAAVVTFHAALPTPTAEEAKAIKARILVCHGAEDAFIPGKAIQDFKAALDAAKTSYQFESYKGAVHSFTVAEADKKNIQGMKYNEEADKKSWQQMQDLFKNVFGK